MKSDKRYRLGKLAPVNDPRTLKLANYIDKVPAPPESMGYIDKVTSWPMMGNDVLGDCTCAAAGHMVEQWSTFANPPGYTPTDKEVISAYSAVSGYVPGKPSTDRGAFMLDVLKYWRNTGIGGHKIAAFVSVNPQDRNEVQQAISLFGNCYVGLDMPVSAQDATDGKGRSPVWSVPDYGAIWDGSPGTWGGHAVPVVGYRNSDQVVPGKIANAGMEVVTWGAVYAMTWNFMDAYCDEAYAVLSSDWISSSGFAPSHFNLQQLQADLAQL